MKKALIFLYLSLLWGGTAELTAQALPISIDSRFGDWTSEAAGLVDAAGDGTNVDFLRFAAANDDTYLFLQLETAQELNLTESNKITLYLDTDNNASTGMLFSGIGADLTVYIGEKEAFYQLSNASGWYSLNDLTFRHQPTVSSTVFEIAISRETLSFTGSPLFPGNEIRLIWEDGAGSNGDRMPDAGESFTYVFDNSPTSPAPLMTLEKDHPGDLRLLTWNTLHDGLDDIDRAFYFDRVIGVLQPDIVTFNECWDMEAPQVASFMNAAVPIGNFQSWQAVKLDQGNITASRYPILQNWLIFPGHRLTASLIDLPDNQYPTDILVINAHLKCCGDGDYSRQRETDAFINFILDAKTPGGNIDLPEGTPFVLSGDLNLVGDRQQLTTLLTGEIVNSGQFGPGGAPDWDNSELQDVISLQTDQRMAFTWENDYSDYPPSRLDFHILSNSVLTVEKAYSLNTQVMSAERLTGYGLGQYDTYLASDHLPKVTDLSIAGTTATRSVSNSGIQLSAAPNPGVSYTDITIAGKNGGKARCLLQNTDGKTVRTWETDLHSGKQVVTRLDWEGLPAGLYFFMVKTEEEIQGMKLLHTGK